MGSPKDNNKNIVTSHSHDLKFHPGSDHGLKNCKKRTLKYFSDYITYYLKILYQSLNRLYETNLFIESLNL